MSSSEPAGLLDSSTLIDLVELDPDSLPTEPAICTITLAELSVGPLVARSPRERAARQALLQQAEADFEPLPFDAGAARAFGSVAASLRQAGRKLATRAFDALLAAVAVSQDLPLYTANPSDFIHIDGLDVRTVPHLDQQ